jgi:hypothetical protein
MEAKAPAGKGAATTTNARSGSSSPVTPAGALASMVGAPLTDVAPYALGGGQDPREIDPATGVPRQPAQPSPYRVVLRVADDVPGIASRFFEHGQMVEAGFSGGELATPHGQNEMATIMERILFRHRLGEIVLADRRLGSIAARCAEKLGTRILVVEQT